MFKQLVKSFGGQKAPVLPPPVPAPALSDIVDKLSPDIIASQSYDRIKLETHPELGKVYICNVPGLTTRSYVRTEKVGGADQVMLHTDVLYRHKNQDYCRAQRVSTIPTKDLLAKASGTEQGVKSLVSSLSQAVTYGVLRDAVMASATLQLAEHLSEFAPFKGTSTAHYHSGWAHHGDIKWRFVKDAKDAQGFPMLAIAPILTAKADAPESPEYKTTLPLQVVPVPSSFADCAMSYCKSASDKFGVIDGGGKMTVHVFGQELLNHAWGSVFADSSAQYQNLLERAPLLADIARKLDDQRGPALQEISARHFWSEAGGKLREQALLAARYPAGE